MLRRCSLCRIVRWTYPVFLLSTSMARAEEQASASSEPAAAATEEASKAFWSGKEYYDQGQYREAQEQFRKAYDLTNDAALLYDIAQSYRKMGQCELALQNYQQFLRVAPPSALVSQAEKHVSTLQSTCPASQSEEPTAAVSGETQPSAATRPASLAPLPPTATSFAMEPNTSQHVRRVMLGGSVATLAAGLVTGGFALGIEVWNHRRFEQWQARDRDLEQGPLPGESPAQWLVRQQSNDQFGSSINRANSEVLVLGLGAGALIATSAVLFFSAPKQAQAKMQPARISWQPAMLGSKFTGFSVLGSF